MGNKIARLIPLIVVFVFAVVMLIVNLNNIGITVDVVLGVGWALVLGLVLGMSGTLLGIKIRDYINENKEFSDFEKSNMIDYRILNDGTIEESVEKLIRIICKHKGKEKNV